MADFDYEKQALWLRNRAQELILEKWSGSKACPICENLEWVAYEPQGVVPVIDNSFAISMSMPLIPLACDNCGFTHFFNAKILGITTMPGEGFAEDE